MHVHVRPRRATPRISRNNRARAWSLSRRSPLIRPSTPRPHHTAAASRPLTEFKRRGHRCRCHAIMKRSDGAEVAGFLGRLVRTAIALADHLRRLRVKDHTRRTRSAHEVYGHKTRARCNARHLELTTSAEQAARASGASGGACHPCCEPVCPGPQCTRVAVGRSRLTTPMIGSVSEPP